LDEGGGIAKVRCLAHRNHKRSDDEAKTVDQGGQVANNE